MDIVSRKAVVVLYARRDSVYKTFLDDVFDEDRDARTYQGRRPVVAHPPCRAWGRLRTFAKPRHDEKDLAFHAVQCVRACGGVLEHPAHSTLWEAANLPAPGSRDQFGGFTYVVNQSWFGHAAPKLTWLYIVGAERWLPSVPFRLGMAEGRVASQGRAAREATPLAFALWLASVAAQCKGATE